MAFGFGGGGAMFGGSAATTASRAGLPFGGIPEELMDEATKLLATEPEHPKSHVHFTQLPSAKERERLTPAAPPRRLPEVGRRRVGPRHHHQLDAAGGSTADRVRHPARYGGPPRPLGHRGLCAAVSRARRSSASTSSANRSTSPASSPRGSCTISVSGSSPSSSGSVSTSSPKRRPASS